MPESDRQYNEQRSQMKVSQLVRILHSVENICELTEKNGSAIHFLREIRSILHEYEHLNANDLISALKETLSEHALEQRKAKKRERIEELDIRNMPLDVLKTLLRQKHLTKEQLLDIGQIRFGIPKGTNKKVTKEQLQGLIESTIENVEMLDTISQKASE